MITPAIVTARDILRNYKKVFEKVKRTKEPVVVIAKKKPQVAIISLDGLEDLQKLKYKTGAKALLDIAIKAQKILRDEKLPKDLSEKHDYYGWRQSKQF